MKNKAMKTNYLLDIREVKELELQLLVSFHKICMQQGWHYSLTAGTLIGAVRHKGFIPWDDDIDVMMPRSDYNDFLNYCKQHKTPFRVVSCEQNINYGALFAKISDKSTVIEDDFTDWSKVEMGVNIDIFPIDGLGDTIESAKKNVNKHKFLNSLIVAKNWKCFTLSKTHPFYYEPIRLIFFILSRIVPMHTIIKKVNISNQRIGFSSSRYSGCLCGVYKDKTIMKSSDFIDLVDLPFEGYSFKAIRKYDSYLRRSYGDYMVLPKESDRVEHHGVRAYKK